ncbi:hypothetical protein F5144DRAFT_547417 [Chaetomium tenue]|uniref:Uncharacterized protein n=1 Tax=Chaetomium tenue TaxID=1854479 RepID=A0ACB7P8W5_9PEZI|nr:hypothetical protein F5144DRAFT_547417 [Chaetomium globosum]
MTTEIFRDFHSPDIPDTVLVQAAELFSNHYGIWNTPAGRPGGKPGTRVKLNVSRLRSQHLPPGARCSYVSVHVDEALAGNVFACRWEYQGRQVCWITQLVVHREYRGRRLATRLIEKLRDIDDEIFGIMSSHPAACIAGSKACAGFPLPHISRHFIQSCAKEVMASSAIPYVRDAKLRGALFSDSATDTEGLISGADTEFYVDHEEPLSALAWIRAHSEWPLGDLPEGHEFLFMCCVRRRVNGHPIKEVTSPA